jgi:hypothetical protein
MMMQRRIFNGNGCWPGPVDLVVQKTVTIIAREGFELIQVKNKNIEGAAAQL